MFWRSIKFLFPSSGPSFIKSSSTASCRSSRIFLNEAVKRSITTAIADVNDLVHGQLLSLMFNSTRVKQEVVGRWCGAVEWLDRINPYSFLYARSLLALFGAECCTPSSNYLLPHPSTRTVSRQMWRLHILSVNLHLERYTL